MSAKVERSESLENTCPVCHDQIEIYAIGQCDHPVCYRCSTRMRVLCEQMDCPICRSQMPQVAFVYGRLQFKDISLRNCIPNRKYKIFFEDEEVEDKYLDLLEYRCRICRNRAPDRTFAQLQTHMRREHQLFACDLCVSHLKIFPFERKFYSRKYLAIHRRVGDSDDKSYKGHPLCEFCDTRYNDKDELHRHLRKDHYYCHFCDQEGSNTYYDQYPDVLKHFSESHFLCTEGECASAETRFTHAFASEIDLKAHKASTHNKNWSKAQSREARTIELDFHLPPRRQGNSRREDFEEGRSSHGGRGKGNDRYNRRRDYDQDDYDLQRAIEASKESARASEATPAVEERVPDPVNDFPTLNGAIIPATVAQNTYSKPTRSPEEEFPSLSSKSSAKSSKQQPSFTNKAYSSVMNFQVEPKPAPPVKKESKPVSLGSVAKVPRERWSGSIPKNTEEEYPSLGGSSSTSNNIRTAHTEQRSAAVSKKREEDYPALAGNTSTSNGIVANDASSGWLVKSRHNNNVSSKTSITQRDNNHKRKTSEPISSRTITDENEFPTLSGQGQKRSNGVFGNPLSDWSKQNKSSSKKTSKSKAEKCDDDSFELPESYYKSYDDPSPPQSASSPPKETSDTSEVVEATPKPAPVNSTKEFPGLPMRESQPESLGEKKKKKKNKKPQEKPNAKNERKSEDASASLSEIALALVKPVKGKDADKSSGRPPKPTDWFDNPPTDLSETPKSSPRKAEAEKGSSKKTDTPASAPKVDSDSFPSLHAMSISVQQPKPPPGFASDPPPSAPAQKTSVSAPPGFMSQKLQATSTPSPPPGFTRNAIYIQPTDFKTRNLKLIEDIRQALVTIEDGFSNFKVLSGQFRQGVIEASDYYFSCQALMGEEDFIKVFPELLALLPDISKQCELWDVHQANSEKKSKGQGSKAQMLQCQTCGQVMMKHDAQHHELQHGSLSDFPSLGDPGKTSSSGSSGTGPDIQLKGTWIKAK